MNRAFTAGVACAYLSVAIALSILASAGHGERGSGRGEETGRAIAVVETKGKPQTPDTGDGKPEPGSGRRNS